MSPSILVSWQQGLDMLLHGKYMRKVYELHL